VLFDYWNNQKIIKHETLNDNIKKSIDKALKNYTEEQIKTAMSVYGEVLNNQDKYYFGYKWSLEEFLTRKNAIVKFLNREVAISNFKRSNGLKPTIQQSSHKVYKPIEEILGQ
jgi:hypothetical protein